MPRRLRPATGETAVGRALHRLDERGLELPVRPRDLAAPQLPDDLTELSSDSLMGLMVALTNWLSYAAGELSMAAIAEREAEGVLAMAQARAAVAARAEKSVAAQKAAAADDPAVREALADLTEAYSWRKALEGVHAGLDAKARVVSRDLTRRTGARDMDSRAARFSP